MERSNCTLEQALSTTYGVELMEDNVKLCKERLAGPNPTQEILDILDKNIVCHDALTYDYSFGGEVWWEGSGLLDGCLFDGVKVGRGCLNVMMGVICQWSLVAENCLHYMMNYFVN